MCRKGTLRIFISSEISRFSMSNQIVQFYIQFLLIFSELAHIFVFFHKFLFKLISLSIMQLCDENLTQSQKKTTKYNKFIADDDSDPDQTCPTDLTANLSQKWIEAKQQTEQSKNIKTDQKDIKNQKKGKQSKKKKANQMQAINKQEKKEKYFCRFYMQGTCKKGSTCTFTHPVEVPSSMGQAKKSKQAKLEPYAKNKSKQESNKMIDQKEEYKTQIKHPRDVYYQKMIETMKQDCYSCKKRQLLVVLSCGCNTICEDCVKSKMVCSKENHLYDNKVYIK